MSTAACFYILVGLFGVVVSFKMGFHCGYEYREYLIRTQVGKR